MGKTLELNKYFNRRKSIIEGTLSLSREFFYVFIIVLPFAYLVFMVRKYSVDIPFMDQWTLVPLIEKAHYGNLSIHDFWAQHDVQRLFFPKLIMISLARLSGWNTIYELAFNIALAVGVFVGIIWQTSATLKTIGYDRRNWAIPGISFMVFSLNQVQCWLHGWQMQTILNVFAVTSGVVLLAMSGARWLGFIIAVLLGVVASYSYANGLVYWFIGCFIILSVFPRKRRKPIQLGLWMLAGCLTIFFFFYGYRMSGEGTYGFILKQPVEYILYVSTFLGGPLLTYGNRLNEVPLLSGIPFIEKAAALIGLLGIVCSCTMGWLLIRFRGMKLSSLAPYFALCFYSIGSACVTGFGRAGGGVQQTFSSRYVTIGNLLWISNIVLLYLYVISRGRESKKLGLGRIKKGVLVTIFVIILLVGISSAHRSISAANTYRHLWAARSEIISADEGNAYLGLRSLYPNVKTVRAYVPILKKHRLSLFRESESEGLGRLPTIADVRFKPDKVVRNGTEFTLITASVSDSDSNLAESGSVSVDLPWQVMRNQPMYDNGTNGDITAGDGIYSYLARIPETVCDVPQMLVLTATDDGGNTALGWGKLTVVDPGAVYLDNSDAELFGEDWICESEGWDIAAFGGDYCYASGNKGLCTAKWTVELSDTGRYDVYAWLPAGPIIPRSSNARYEIHDGESSRITQVSHVKNPGNWAPLGTYFFRGDTKSYLLLVSDSEENVIVDAIKWKRRS